MTSPGAARARAPPGPRPVKARRTRPHTARGPRRGSARGPASAGCRAGVRCTDVQLGKSARSIGPRSLSATTPKTQCTSRPGYSERSAGEQHLHPGGVVSAVQQHGGRAAPAPPAGRASEPRRAPPAAASGETESPRAESSSRQASATAAFCRWCSPRSPSVRPSSDEARPLRRRGGHPGGPPGRSPVPRGAGARPPPAALRSMAARASGSWRLTTTGTPGLRMPAFSPAMAPSVLPRYSMWSKDTGVMAVTSGWHAFVASSRPPRPASSTATSTRLAREVPEGHHGAELEVRERGRPAAG